MICSDFTLLLVLTFLLKDVVSVSTSKEFLKSSKEYYLFKPVFSMEGVDLEGDTFSTLLSKVHGIHVPEFFVSFTANNTRYEIHLELNKGLIPKGFSVAYLGGGKHGEDILEKHSPTQINNCYYHGHVVGVENSQVVASTCNGLKGSIFLPHDLLMLSPVDDRNLMHALYRPDDVGEQFCGTHHFDLFHKAMTVSEAVLSPVRLKRATEERKFIELMFVADNAEFKQFSDRAQLHDHVKDVVNHIDALYKKLDLRVVLLHVEVWVGGDKITSDSQAQNVLSKFLSYRREKIQTTDQNSPWRYTDNAQLLYGRSFDGSTVGMATVSSMCSLRSGGVNEDKKNALQTAATVAHEMGHNLGMSHDTNECNCDGRRCVMAATTGGSYPNSWTDCSVQYLHKGFQHGTGMCLSNVPDSTRLFGGPKCGNGIVEKGEECDCGLPDECDSKCCNATTCQLLTEVECDSGACCTADCFFKTSCSECRSIENDCDIAEYCSGHSAHCPGNIHKMDGMDCMSGGGVCYGGSCRTHEMQCREIWGSAAQNGKDVCYTAVNKKGNSNGNCGREGVNFKKCPDKDAKCGKLQCMGGKDYPQIASDRVFFRNKFQGDPEVICKTLSSLNESSDTDPGLVWDGIKCGEGQICFNGMCSNVAQVLKPCSADCHGHGICNNFGNCHCEEGWAMPDCATKGSGGSIDSGPICVSGVEMQVVLLLVFFLVILPIILTMISVIWWRYCGGKQKVYAWRNNRAYRRGERNSADVREARKASAGTGVSSQPSSGVTKPPPRRSNDYRPHVPNTRVDTASNFKQPTMFKGPRPPPPARPSPRLPTRPAPPTPTKPPLVPLKPIPPVAFRRAADTNGSNSNPTSVQARIAQLSRNNAV